MPDPSRVPATVSENQCAARYTRERAITNVNAIASHSHRRRLGPAAPPYNLTPVVRKEVLDKNPKITDALNAISTKLNDETMAKLKELGFEVVLDPKTAKLVIGRLPIDKLAALADLKSVRYVAPQLRNN